MNQDSPFLEEAKMNKPSKKKARAGRGNKKQEDAKKLGVKKFKERPSELKYGFSISSGRYESPKGGNQEGTEKKFDFGLTSGGQRGYQSDSYESLDIYGNVKFRYERID